MEKKTFDKQTIETFIQDAIEFRFDKFDNYANENEFYCKHDEEYDFTEAVYDYLKDKDKLDASYKSFMDEYENYEWAIDTGDGIDWDIQIEDLENAMSIRRKFIDKVEDIFKPNPKAMKFTRKYLKSDKFNYEEVRDALIDAVSNSDTYTRDNFPTHEFPNACIDEVKCDLFTDKALDEMEDELFNGDLYDDVWAFVYTGKAKSESERADEILSNINFDDNDNALIKHNDLRELLINTL